MRIFPTSLACFLAPFVLLAVAQDDPPQVAETTTLTVIALDEDGDGIFGASVSLDPSEAELDAARLPDGNVFLRVVSAQTDPDGFAALEVPIGERRTLTVAKLNVSNMAKVEVEPLKAGEEREIEVRLKTKPDLDVTAVVVGAENGKPIEGVEVRVDDTAGAPSFSSRPEAIDTESRPQTVSDADGRFTVPAKSWLTPGAWLTAPGRSPVMVFLVEDSAARTANQPIAMTRAASLRGTVTAKKGSVPAGTTVQITVEGSDLGDGTEAMALAIPDALFVARVGEDGQFEFDQLPAAADASLTVNAGDRVLLREAAPRTFAPGSSQEIALVLGAGTPIAGRVSAADGAACKGTKMWLLPRENRSTGFFRPYEKPARVTQTDSRGRYQFKNVAPGEWLVGPAPDEQGSRAGSPDASACLNAAITAGDKPVEQDFTLYRGLYIRGVVYAPDDETPAEGVFVVAGQGSAYVSAQLTGDGGFRIGPLVPGSWVVQATPRSSMGPARLFTDAEAVTATPTSARGLDPVELTLRDGAAWDTAAVDAETGESVPTSMCLLHNESTFGRVTVAPTSSTELTQIPAGAYTLCLRAEDGRVAVVATTLKPREDRGGKRAILVPGGFAKVTYEGDAPRATLELLSNGLVVDKMTISSGESCRLQGPVGPAVVAIRSPQTGAITEPFKRTYDVQIAAGETIELNAKIDDD